MTTIAARLRRKPGRRGRALLEEFERLGFETIEAVCAAAKVAGHSVHRNTVRRVLFEDGSILQLPTFDALKAVGVDESVLRM